MPLSIRGGVLALGFLALSPAALAQAQVNINAPNTPDELLNALHKDNQQEISLAQLAQQKAQLQETKDVANRILQDHQNLDNQVKQLATQLNVTLGPKPPDGEIAKKFDTLAQDYRRVLQGVTGPAFDSAYLSDQVQEHDKDLWVLRSSQAQLAGNPQMAQLIGQVIPQLAQHRSAAYDALGEAILQNAPAVGGAGRAVQPVQPMRPEHPTPVQPQPIQPIQPIQPALPAPSAPHPATPVK